MQDGAAEACSIRSPRHAIPVPWLGQKNWRGNDTGNRAVATLKARIPSGGTSRNAMRDSGDGAAMNP